MLSMAAVHTLILHHGVEGARALASSKLERQAIEAAAIILAEEESRLGITHAGFAMTSLPHKRIEECFWKREGVPNDSPGRIRKRSDGQSHRRALRVNCPADPALSANRSNPYEFSRGGAWALYEVMDESDVADKRRSHIPTRDRAGPANIRLPIDVFHRAAKRDNGEPT